MALTLLNLALNGSAFDLCKEDISVSSSYDPKIEVQTMLSPAGKLNGVKLNLAEPFLVVREADFAFKSNGRVFQGDIVYKIKDADEGTYFAAWDWQTSQWVAGIVRDKHNIVPLKEAFTDSFKSLHPECQTIGLVGEEGDGHKSAAFYDIDGNRVLINRKIGSDLAEAYWRSVSVDSGLNTDLSRMRKDSIKVDTHYAGFVCNGEEEVVCLLVTKALLSLSGVANGTTESQTTREVDNNLIKIPDINSLKRSIRNNDFQELIEGVDTRDIVVQAKAIASQLFKQNRKERVLFTKNDKNYLPYFRSHKFSLLSIESAMTADAFVFDYESNITFPNAAIEKNIPFPRALKSISIYFDIIANEGGKSSQVVFSPSEAFKCNEVIALKLAKMLSKDGVEPTILLQDELFDGCPPLKLGCDIRLKGSHTHASLHRVRSDVFFPLSAIQGGSLNTFHITLLGDAPLVENNKQLEAENAAVIIVDLLSAYAQNLDAKTVQRQ